MPGTRCTDCDKVGYILSDLDICCLYCGAVALVVKEPSQASSRKEVVAHPAIPLLPCA